MKTIDYKYKYLKYKQKYLTLQNQLQQRGGSTDYKQVDERLRKLIAKIEIDKEVSVADNKYNQLLNKYNETLQYLNNTDTQKVQEARVEELKEEQERKEQEASEANATAKKAGILVRDNAPKSDRPLRYNDGDDFDEDEDIYDKLMDIYTNSLALAEGAEIRKKEAIEETEKAEKTLQKTIAMKKKKIALKQAYSEALELLKIKKHKAVQAEKEWKKEQLQEEQLQKKLQQKKTRPQQRTNQVEIEKENVALAEVV